MSAVAFDPFLDTPIWFVEAIDKVIGRNNPAATNRMLAKGLLDADKINGAWTSTPRRLFSSMAK
jgi:hypothetical protein